MKNLEVFCARHNRLRTIAPEIGLLSKLKVLILSNNQLRNLPSAVSQLHELEELSIGFNSFVFLPQFLSLMPKLKKLRVRRNILPFVPPRLRFKGDEDLINYLKQNLDESSKKRYRAKIMVVGDENIGKSTLIQALITKRNKYVRLLKTAEFGQTVTQAIGKKIVGEKTAGKIQSKLRGIEDKIKGINTALNLNIPILNMANIATDGIAITKWKLTDPNLPKGSSIDFSVWDFAGQESEKTIYLVVFNLLDDTFSRIDYWLNSIALRANTSPVILVGTHIDDPKCTSKYVKEVLIRVMDQFSKFPNIAGVVAASGKTGKGTGKLRKAILEEAAKLPNFNAEVPVSYNKLLKKIKLKQRSLSEGKYTPPIFSVANLNEIAVECGIAETDLQPVMNFLNDVGAILYFEKINPDIVVFDPQWLTNMFATIITLKNNFVKDGILLESNLAQVWKPPLYPESFHAYMLSLMEEFGVILRIPESSTKEILVPGLLRNEKKSSEKEWELIWPPLSQDAWVVGRYYSFQFIPAGFFGRLIITSMRQNAWKLMDYWRNGIIISQGQDKVLLELNESKSELMLYCRGPSKEKHLVTFIGNIDTLINDWLQVKVIVTVPCGHCIKEKCAKVYEFPLANCIRAATSGVTTVYCDKFSPILMKDLCPDVTLECLGDVIPVKDIEMGKMIGKGGFAEVLIGTWKGEQVAIKKVNLGGGEAVDETSTLDLFLEFKREVSLMSSIKHPRIVELKGVIVNPFCLVMEFMSCGDLYGYLHESSEQLEWTLILELAHDIAIAMEFLHSLKPPVIHRDLKSPNVLLSKDDKRVIAKVSDFGLSRELLLCNSLQKQVVDNPIWLAPEVLRKEVYTEKVDVYAAGVIFWELLTRKDFFGNFKFFSQIEDTVLRGERPPIPDVPDDKKPFEQIIESCWDDSALNRPMFGMVVIQLENMMVEYQANPADFENIHARKKVHFADN